MACHLASIVTFCAKTSWPHVSSSCEINSAIKWSLFQVRVVLRRHFRTMTHIAQCSHCRKDMTERCSRFCWIEQNLWSIMARPFFYSKSKVPGQRTTMFSELLWIKELYVRLVMTVGIRDGSPVGVCRSMLASILNSAWATWLFAWVWVRLQFHCSSLDFSLGWSPQIQNLFLTLLLFLSLSFKSGILPFKTSTVSLIFSTASTTYPKSHYTLYKVVLIETGNTKYEDLLIKSPDFRFAV